jgi:hypothetical protein
LEAQVLDCLDIIQASIEKAPQALWESGAFSMLAWMISKQSRTCASKSCSDALRFGLSSRPALELLSEIQSQLRVDEDVTDINKLICIVLKAGLELKIREFPQSLWRFLNAGLDDI